MFREGVSDLVHHGCVFEITTCRESGGVREIRGRTMSGQCRVSVWESRIGRHHDEAGGAVGNKETDCLRGVREMQP